MRVLSVASEMFPYVKTGGLADVVGALPAVLAEEGVEITSLIPGYRSVLPKNATADLVTLDEGVMAVNLPALFDRAGGPYIDESGTDFLDNLERFSSFAARAAEVAVGKIKGLPAFDLVHAHDWQAAAIVGHLHALAGAEAPPVVFTIHNLAFQGRYGGGEFLKTGLPAAYFDREWFEFYGDVNLLKAAILRSAKVTTVSETYASEICTHEFGFGLNQILESRGRDLVGIVNGLDTTVWNPATDKALPQPFTAATAKAGKAAAKKALQDQCGLMVDPDRPLFTLVSRLSDQKGIDLIAGQIDALVFGGAQVAMLGSGDPQLTAALHGKAVQHPTQVHFTEGYDETFAHMLHGAGDFFLVPSRFEPCGLTQLSAQRYGAVPVVAPTGGLADTVVDANEAALRLGAGTGIVMRSVTASGLGHALSRALSLYADRALFEAVQANALALDVGWSRSAKAYRALYDEVVGGV